MITPSSVERIRDAARVEEVVGEFVNLKRRGVNLIGLCPFHDEKTPSFTVSPAKGLFKCFGCGKGGDSVKFLMEHEHFTYPEALKYLAKKFGVEVEETEETPEYKEEQSRKEALFAVNAFAEQYFADNLWETEKGKAIGLSYFLERGFTEETIRKFRLGYALEEWDHLLKAAKEKGYKEEYLKELGLVSKGEKTVDIYRGRVMFPIHNLSGRVLGFGGRILNSKEKAAKYINSPESEIYNKSKTLYGLFQGKKEILAKDRCYLVEGYTDVISLHQAGIENAVASSGTSLTTDQVKMIRRFTQHITILYDGDNAGIKASFRGIDMILEEGMNVKVVLFPNGEDPDSFSRKNDTETLREFLQKEEKDFIGFKASILLQEAGNDPIRKAGVIRDMVESIALVKDTITRSRFVQSCSIIMGIEEKVLYFELNNILRNKLRKKEDSLPIEYIKPEESIVNPSIFVDSIVYQEKEIIKILLKSGDKTILYPISYFQQNENSETLPAEYYLAEIIFIELDGEFEWSNLTYYEIFKEIEVLVSKDSLSKIKNYFLSHFNEDIREVANEIITNELTISRYWEEKYDIIVPSNIEHWAFKSLLEIKIRKLLKEIEKKKYELYGVKIISSSHYDLYNEIKVAEKTKMKIADFLTRVILP